jgi:CheY-like chemotaxis protein
MANILIVDDDKMVREAARIVLQAKGYEVEVAADGKSGIEAAKAGSFDVAIVDLFMPDLDGLQVMEAIRKLLPKMPMIAASGFMFGGNAPPSMPNFATMAAEAGATVTLYKPFRPDALLQAVADALAQVA